MFGLLGFGLLGAALFWLRGSAYFGQITGRGKTTADAVWAFALALPALYWLPWYWIPLLTVSLFLGGRLPWWKSIDMGRNTSVFDNTTYLRDFVLQTARGVLWVLLTAVLLWFVVGWSAGWLLLAGLLCAVLYEIGWQLNPTSKWWPKPTEIGEMLFGFAIGAGLYNTLSGG